MSSARAFRNGAFTCPRLIASIGLRSLLLPRHSSGTRHSCSTALPRVEYVGGRVNVFAELKRQQDVLHGRRRMNHGPQRSPHHLAVTVMLVKYQAHHELQANGSAHLGQMT